MAVGKRDLVVKRQQAGASLLFPRNINWESGREAQGVLVEEKNGWKARIKFERWELLQVNNYLCCSVALISMERHFKKKVEK